MTQQTRAEYYLEYLTDLERNGLPTVPVWDKIINGSRTKEVRIHSGWKEYHFKDGSYLSSKEGNLSAERK